jgi:hypothetical protein
MALSWTQGFEPWFLDAASSCALRNADTDTATLENYFRTKLRYIDAGCYTKLSKKLTTETPLDPRVVTVEKETTQALSPIHFVYMDVGCWAGTGDDEATRTNGWTKHREFGIVFGHLILLCALASKGGPDHYARYTNPPAWDKDSGQLVPSPLIDATITRHPDWPKVQELLNKLADCIPNCRLYILGATSLTSIYVPVPARGKAAPITIFLGDLHVPVATSSANAHILEGGKEMLRGRLEINTADLQVMPGAPGSEFADISFKLSQRISESLRELQWDRTTTSESVERWLSLYHVEGQRTADIFQDAGKDLRTFVDALASFHQDTWPLELVQLGDLFDLWLGFQRAFGEQLGQVPALDNLHGKTLDFARFWVERSLFATDQGPHLVHLLTLGERAGKNRQTDAPLRTTFLHGNHDNYLKHGGGTPIEVPAGHEHAGMKIHAFHLPSFVEKAGLWAEHGHQPDIHNRDEDPTRGHELTQAAFFQPGVRNLEGPAGWAVSMGEGKGIQRVISIRHALDQCLLKHVDSAQPCRGVYVMGHTHEAMLKRIELWPCPPYQYRKQ